MHDLQGKLSVFGPITALQMPKFALASGKLQMTVDGNTATVYFERGNITWAGLANRRMRIGEYLIDKGILTERNLKRALALKAKGDRRLGMVLVEEGLVDEAYVAAHTTG